MGTGGAGIFVILMFVVAPIAIGPYEKLNKALSEPTKKTLTWIWIAIAVLLVALKVIL